MGGVLPRDYLTEKSQELALCCGYMGSDDYRDHLRNFTLWWRVMNSGKKSLTLLEAEAEHEPFVYEDLAIPWKPDAIFTRTWVYRGQVKTWALVVDYKTGRYYNNEDEARLQTSMYAYFYSQEQGLDYSQMETCVVHTSDLYQSTKKLREIKKALSERTILKHLKKRQETLQAL